MSGELPWFPWFPKDWLTGAPATMTPEQRGFFIQLLSYAWAQGGSLPADADELAVLAGTTPERWAQVGAKVRAQFDVRGDGRLVNAKLAGLHQEATDRAAKYQARARKGAEALHRGKKAERAATPRPQAGLKRASSKPAASAGQVTLSEVLAPYGELAKWAQDTPRRDTLRRALAHARDRQGVNAPGRIAALANTALQLPTHTPEQLEAALGDWPATDNDGSPNSFRAFLRGALPSKGGGKAESRKPKGSAVATAADVAKLTDGGF